MNFVDIEEFLQTALSLLEEAKECFSLTNNWLNNVFVAINSGVVHRTWAHAIRNSKMKLASSKNPGALPNMTLEEQRMHEKAIDFYVIAYEYIHDKTEMKEMKLKIASDMTKTVGNFIKEMWDGWNTLGGKIYF